MGLYMVFLFVVLSPGILLRIPPKGSKLVVATVHGLVFALVYCLTYKFVLNATYVEHFQNVRDPKNCELYGKYAKDSYKAFEDEKNPRRKKEAERKFYRIRDQMMNYCQPVKPPPKKSPPPPPVKAKPGDKLGFCKDLKAQMDSVIGKKNSADTPPSNQDIFQRELIRLEQIRQEKCIGVL